MKHVAIGILAVMAYGQAHAASEAAIMGLWARGDGKARVRIERCGSAICAVNTWIRPDVPDEKIGDRLGMNIAPRGGTLAGEAFDPQRNLTFRIRIEASERAMTTHGCMLAGLVCKNMNWRRSGE